MSLKSTAMLSAVPDVPFKPQEYRQPLKDRTTIKAKILRRCWLKTAEGQPMQTVDAGTIIQLERWIGEELRANGKADLL
jgi:hypothetical protein